MREGKALHFALALPFSPHNTSRHLPATRTGMSHVTEAMEMAFPTMLELNKGGKERPAKRQCTPPY